MSHQPAPASARTQAAERRAKADVLASVLRDSAPNGHPAPESRVRRENPRDARLERPAAERPRVA
ncbi:hypothetical protein [Streptomyces sp. NPDC053755]|uniref:hypothetical protein n=1 Tax=Streptomyces sp. NPDC053755 TaxID=3155815 RepID=UPI00343F0AFC